ncbi:response regulator transcription factor [Pseudomonas sp. HK3]
MFVLLVEDEIEFAALTIEYLESEGIVCDHAVKGSAALTFITDNEYDVILLDVNLPDMNGFDVCRQYRKQGINTPTIMLTARSSIDDKSAGFTVGVDDYLVKPFAMQELVMRLQALNQRGKRSSLIIKGALQLNVADKQASIHNVSVSLTPDEWRLLCLLAMNNATLSKAKIMNHLWADDSGSEDALKMLVSRLRKVLRNTLDINQFDSNLIQIETIRGVGLRLISQ